MPTSPSPPLKFRTVGFPQYGFKTSMSDSAFLGRNLVKPAPGMPALLPSLPPSFRSLPLQVFIWLCVQINPRFHGPLFERPTASLPQGSLAPGPSYVVSVYLCLYYDPIRQSPQARCAFVLLIRNAFAVRERLGIPRDFPYFHCCGFPCMSPTLPRRSTESPIVLTRRFQASSNYQ